MWVLKGSTTAKTAAFWAEILESVSVVVSFYEQEEGIWMLEGLSDTEPNLAHLQKTLNTYASDENPAPHFTCEQLPERNWLEENKRAFPPLVIGDFYLYGSHHTDPPPPDKHALLIDAATAFGSGHHATTAGCLLLLQEQAQKNPWKSACDLGCGSGILALAMACLNPQAPVLALDNDPEAVTVSTRNVARNHQESHVTVKRSEGFRGLARTSSFDLIVANILAQPLIDLAPSIHGFLRPGGDVILSGFLDTQWTGVQHAYISQGFTPKDHFIQDHWVTLCLQKPA